MSTAIVIFTHEFEQIRQRKISTSSNFEQLTAKIRKLTHRVKQEWSNLSVEDREGLKEFAYNWLEPPAPKGVFSLKLEIWAIIYFFYLRATNQREAFRSCMKAMNTLVETILDAVERQEPSYQSVLSDTLEQLYSGAIQGEELKPEETRDWLRSLSDEALGEV
ncbi:MAG: hypothetical protein RMY64_25565 [Nostoc sp. DedQUE08]|uniref:hypothetical protein n=1 Tax=Nostoc sp. DedQUE08 TaxID=3075393 RepID=UPI002AD36F9A|nr:hypothetical protein [Nostoc sp. DedQUE08]MDZ8068963.1 hypothetical protein [Nostoc sp. DedQUE08]